MARFQQTKRQVKWSERKSKKKERNPEAFYLDSLLGELRVILEFLPNSPSSPPSSPNFPPHHHVNLHPISDLESLVISDHVLHPTKTNLERNVKLVTHEQISKQNHS